MPITDSTAPDVWGTASQIFFQTKATLHTDTSVPCGVAGHKESCIRVAADLIQCLTCHRMTRVVPTPEEKKQFKSNLYAPEVRMKRNPSAFFTSPPPDELLVDDDQ